jgi:hypothetical protein
MYIPSCCMSSVLFEIYDSHVQTNFGLIQPSSQWLLGVQMSGHNTGYLCPSNYKAKNGWSYTSTPPYVFMACNGRTSPTPMTFTIKKKSENSINVIQKLLLIIWTFLECQFPLSYATWKLNVVTTKHVRYVGFTPKFSPYMAYLFLLCFQPRTLLIQSRNINMYTVILRFCLKYVF